MCYCSSDCSNEKCQLHKVNVDWSVPRHKYYGASFADFSEKCGEYK